MLHDRALPSQVGFGRLWAGSPLSRRAAALSLRATRVSAPLPSWGGWVDGTRGVPRSQNEAGASAEAAPASLWLVVSWRAT